jgi:autotransporter passenger strand-loop-strand repeat protein
MSGVATGTINSGGQDNIDGVVYNATVANGGYEFIEFGGTASGTTVSSGGTQDVYGTAVGTVINSGGTEYVYSGGSASGTTINSGGTETVNSAGSVSGTTINSGGTEGIWSGGSATGTTINSGGKEYVNSGGSASGITINSGGTLELFGGAAASGITISSGGTLELGNGYTLNISAGQTSNSILLTYSATLNVLAGGTASGTINSGGTVNISAGGTEVNAVINSYNGENVFSGGVAVGTVLSGGYQNIYSGGTAIETTFINYGKNVGGGIGNVSGIAVSAIVSSGGSQIVFAGGAASGTAVNNGGLLLLSAGVASGAMLNGGGLDIQLNGKATSATVLNGGYDSVELGGSDLDAIVSSGGEEYVGVGGMASGATVKGGIDVIFGKTFSAVIDSAGSEYVEAGGTAVGTTIGNGGSQIVETGGAASGATISQGGTQVVQNGGIATGTSILSGGMLDFAEFGFGSSTNGNFAEAASNTSGTLTVTNGVSTAKILLVGQYTTANFHLTSDGHAGTLVSYGSAANVPTISISTIAGDDVLNATEAQKPLAITGTSTGAVGQTVTVSLNGAHYTGTVANDGTWSVTVPQSALAPSALPNGSYTVTADVSDQFGNSAPEATRSLQVYETPHLTEVGNHFFLYGSGGSGGPSLKYAGADILAGQVGGWAPIGAVQTTIGFEVAWKLTGVDEYGVWTTDSSGNFISNTGAVTGESYTLESAELTFNQDLNGDGAIGPSTLLIQTDTNSFGSTTLVRVADQFALGSTSGNGPHLQVNGAPFTTSQTGGWTPLGAVQTATGFDVAWKLTGVDEYGVWTTDSSGNFVSNTGAVTGESYTLESAELTFNQDLNGDGTTGPSTTVIQTDTNSFGSTSLVKVADQYALGSSGGYGPHLQLNGAPFTTSQTGGWTPLGAVQTATGFDVAWKLTGVDEYGVWTTDSSGNFVSNTGAVTGESYTLEAAELAFNQDLNGDGVMGPPTVVIQGNETLELAGPYLGTIRFATANGTLKLDHSSTFSGSITGQLASGDIIDLADISAGPNATIGYSGNNSPGTLTVSDGTHTANIALLGQYMATSFVAASDGHGGTLITDPPQEQNALLSQPGV